jgi:hypothetical protein
MAPRRVPRHWNEPRICPSRSAKTAHALATWRLNNRKLDRLRKGVHFQQSEMDHDGAAMECSHSTTPPKIGTVKPHSGACGSSAFNFNECCRQKSGRALPRLHSTTTTTPYKAVWSSPYPSRHGSQLPLCLPLPRLSAYV